MSDGKLGKGTSILDALDQSFLGGMNSGATVAPNPRIPSFASSSSGNTQETPLDSETIFQLMDVKLTKPSPSRSSTGLQGDFNLNYDQDTPVKTIDVGGPDQEEKLAEFVTKSIDNYSHGLSVQRAMKELGLTSQQDYLPGLEVRLLPHQAIGVAWMLKQENGPHKGGILADDMGLGKTVQMIATIVKNPPTADDDHQTTLIVVPAALLQQWKDEIEAKTNGELSVHIHHGKDKLKSSSAVKSKDVVITSYQTLHADFHTPSDVEPNEEYNWLIRYGGPLARTKFYRAIADEAQFIRNRGTRASTCLAYVRAEYRWMLTGTPVTNSLADIYGLLRFGKFRPYNDWESFNEHVAKVQMTDAVLAGARAQAILRPLLLRRMKNSEIEGRPILQLPPKDIELVKLKFSPDEKALYDSYEKQSQIAINRFIRNGTVLKDASVVLVMILRLRQLCSHPYLILSQTEGIADPTVMFVDESSKEQARARKALGATTVDEVKRRFLLRKAADELEYFNDEAELDGNPECPKCSEMLFADNGRITSCGHEICFDCSLALKNSAFDHDGIFGFGNEKQNEAVEKAFDTAQTKGWRPCPTCGKMIDLGPQKTFKWGAFEPTDQDLRDYARSRRERKKELARKSNGSVRVGSSRSSPAASTKSTPVKDLLELSDSDDDLPGLSSLVRPPKRHKNSHQATSNDDDAMSTHGTHTKSKKNGAPHGSFNKKASGDSGHDGVAPHTLRTWSRGNDDMVPSTKMVEMVKLLKEWELKGDKTIVYSQWTSNLDLIEIVFSHHGIQNVRFDGKMDKASRDKVLAQFKKPGRPNVILISTRSGSVGLNLVVANRVINMDLSWNYAAESQAYDRCHRIGQEKNVYIKRLVVEDTIEERMLRLQEVKQGLSDVALGEGTGIKLGKMSVKDIKYLFGMTKPPPRKDDDNRVTVEFTGSSQSQASSQ